MALFHLIRHGAYALLDQGLGGRLDHPLSAAGQAQAARLAALLAGRPIGAVLSSPVRRALQTAAPIADRLGLVVQPSAAFVEIDFAGWTGATFAALGPDPAWRAWNDFRSVAGVPGGESMLAVQARAMAGLRLLQAANPDGETVVVSHADVIKAILAQALGSPLDLLRRIEVSAGSVSLLQLDATDCRVLSLNHRP